MIKPSDLKNEYNEVESNIFASFKKYIESVKSKFQNNNSIKEIKHLNIYNFDNRIKVEELEDEQEFFQLLDDTKKIDSPFVNSNIVFKNDEGDWKTPIKNFFRRSSCYLNIIDKKEIDPDVLFNDYLRSFRKENTQTTYFALAESVYFSKKNMDFDSFRIHRFNVPELDTIFSRPINEIFYPSAIIDSKRLQNYWFLCVSEVNAFTKITFDYDNKVKLNHSKFSQPVESALKKFSLFDWQLEFAKDSDEKDKLWIAPKIPYVFKVNDNLLDGPSEIYFDYYQLATKPFFDSQTNEEVGEVPDFFIHLDKKETEQFEKFILKFENQLNIISKKYGELNFIDIAFGYFIKAFFSQDDLEELLWHISTIEALLGEKTEGLTNLLARRLALIIAKEREARKKISKEFKELYNFRSKLVHGGLLSKKKKLYVGHLFKARDISRQLILWFLYFICNEKLNIDKNIDIKQYILTSIDLEPENIFNIIDT